MKSAHTGMKSYGILVVHHASQTIGQETFLHQHYSFKIPVIKRSPQYNIVVLGGHELPQWLNRYPRTQKFMQLH